jgi:hypothetical protein
MTMNRSLFEADNETHLPPSSGRHRRPLAIAAIILSVVVAVAAGMWLSLGSHGSSKRQLRQARETTKAGSASQAKAALEIKANVPEANIIVDGRVSGEAPRKIGDLAPGLHRIRVEARNRAAWEQTLYLQPGESRSIEARLMMAAPRLRVESDIPGASVFLDKGFIGKTPLAAREAPRGRHQIDVSAEGFDVYSEMIELDTGETLVAARFKEIRLDERLPVMHRHAVGRCGGQLIASPRELRFESERADHSFVASLAEIENLAVDYLSKNLSLRVRGGKTYNFTVRAKNADPLLVFQKKVERARGVAVSQRAVQ